MGMFSNSIFNPIIGRWIDTERVEKTAAGLSGDALELAVGQDVLLKMTAFPITLVIAFTILLFWVRSRKGTHADGTELAAPGSSL
jgi:hypothetical protein